MSILRHVAFCLLTAVVAAPAWSADAGANNDRQRDHWVAAWTAAPDQAGPPLSGRTIRQIIRPSIGGSSVRIRRSNLFGAGKVMLGPVRIARHASESAIQPGTDQPLTFGGKSTVAIARGDEALSDAVEFSMAAFEPLATSLYVVDSSTASTIHGVGMQSAFITRGEATAAAKFANSEIDTSRYFLTDLEAAITCTRTTQATRPWRRRSICEYFATPASDVGSPAHLLPSGRDTAS